MANWSRENWRDTRSRPKPREATNRKTLGPKHTVPCHHFQRGRCSFGDTCRNSHDLAGGEDRGLSLLLDEYRNDEDLEKIGRMVYNDWKRLIRSYVSHYPYGSVPSNIWERALSVLDGDGRGWHQAVALDLVNDEFQGHNAIRSTMQACMDIDEDHRSLSSSEPFLRVITHASLINCLSVDTYIGTLYRFVAGSNGDQAIPFFIDLARRLEAVVNDTAYDATFSGPVQFIPFLSLISMSAYELLRRERTSLFHESLSELFDALENAVGRIQAKPRTTPQSAGLDAFALLTISPSNPAQTTTAHHTNVGSHSPLSLRSLQTISSQINAMRRMATKAITLLSTSQSDQKKTVSARLIRSAFPVDIIIPGGSHDNDFYDISHIEIFPTIGEIMCKDPEYLPSTDLTQPHILEDAVQRHIDSAFRLLRHDIFGSLKGMLHASLTRQTFQDSKTNPPFGDLRTHRYLDAIIQTVGISERSALKLIISFAAPQQVQRKSLSEQGKWWKASSRLEPGCLVSFVFFKEDKEQVLWFVITEKNTNEKTSGDGRDVESGLVSKRSNPSVTAKLAQQTLADLFLSIECYKNMMHGSLIEVPGIIPDTFEPVLRNLQRMNLRADIPFHRWILPGSGDSDQAVSEIPPPAYAQRPRFVFRLDPILRQRRTELSLDPKSSPSPEFLKELESQTGLDEGQCQGLIAALTREYALIQGPPGTGKSHVGVQLMRVLLHHKREAKLGPILVICYTNHALDQFLEHLLEVDIRRLVRIGGQSKSKKLEGYNLRVVSKAMLKSSIEKKILAGYHSDLNVQDVDARNTLDTIRRSDSSRAMSNLAEQFLQREHPSISSQFASRTSDGYTVVGNDIRTWLGTVGRQSNLADNQPADMDILTTKATRDVRSLSNPERHRIYQHWVSMAIKEETARLFEPLDDARKIRAKIDGVHADENRQALLQVDVIGVTTTGLARNIDLLRHLQSKVIICEEAAEVMEPHLLSAFLPGVEHLIQIGDHQQLRPQIRDYLQFSMETQAGLSYQLDRSQFERRAVGEPGLPPLPVARLNVQRRMRPEISRLIRSVYPNLEDFPAVKELPSVVGMRKDVFWLDHGHPEDSKYDSEQTTSFTNTWEVGMCVALVRHLVRQGVYGSADIAVLTPYAGQLVKLQTALSKDFEVMLGDRDADELAMRGFPGLGDIEDEYLDEYFELDTTPSLKNTKTQLLQAVRIATVDNFQGEEAKVVIVSLVRSNDTRKVGFLRTENRINVLLSRAKHGLYLVGNQKTYLHVDMWADVHGQLAEMDATGRSIALCCPRHPETPIECSEPDDFVRHSPEGGCSLPCDKRMEPCGHRCLASCHSSVLHDAFACPQPCPQIRETCLHRCPKLCGDECGRCSVPIDGVQLPCGHVKDGVSCYQTLDPSSILCSVKISVEVQACGHTVMVRCSQDVTSESFSCPSPCNEIFPCGHQCSGSCGVCKTKSPVTGITKSQHQSCTKTCDRPKGGCQHLCPKKCHQGSDMDCGSCIKPCEVRCNHSACTMKCHEPCSLCIEPCTWSCVHHGTCSLPCAAPCDRLPCQERCPKALNCAHRCPSFCGEDCPESLCQICTSPERKESRVDLLEFKSYAEIDLDESPIVVLGCGHFFTGETLDGLVGMSQVYTLDRHTGQYDGLKDITGFMTSAVPFCPDCKRPIRQFATKRYNRLINKAVIDETSKRFLLDGQRKLQELEVRLKDIECSFHAMSDHSSPVKESPIWRRKSFVETGLERNDEECTKLANEAKNLAKEMTREHQPAKRLFDAIISRYHANNDIEPKSPIHPVYDQQVTLGAVMVELKVRELVLRGKFNLVGKQRSNPGKTTISPGIRAAGPFLSDCKKFIQQASASKLLRLVIMASVSFARIAQLEAWYRKTQGASLATTSPGKVDGTPGFSINDNRDLARNLLAEAAKLCDILHAGEELREAIEEMGRLYEGPRYEQVTPEEMAAIKMAMVSGSAGIATHSGHWYQCVNGHPFAIGECGMPMELATCPECGERIGGQSHNYVEGVSRAMDMERE